MLVMPQVARHQFMMHRGIVEKDVSSSPKVVLHNKRQNMTEAGRNNQVMVASCQHEEYYHSVTSFSNEVVNHRYDWKKCQCFF